MSSSLLKKFCFQVFTHNLHVERLFHTTCAIYSHLANKHWNPKWKKLRALKYIPIELPDFQKEEKEPEDMTPEEIRSYYKELGIKPTRPWFERKFSYQSSVSIFDGYVPPEGDGKISSLNKAGRTQKLQWLKQKTQSWKDLRRIRTFDEDFELYPDFVDLSENIYKKVHESLAEPDSLDKNREDLLDYVTEKAYPEILFNRKNKTIRWKFLQSLEPPRVCHVRTFDMIDKQNIFAQITIRFHTQQTLAIYDRFGRLMYGSESVPKDVLEYVVFEKYLSSAFGSWRIHGKIIPDWLPAKDPSPRTHVLPEELETEESYLTQKDSEADVAMPTVQLTPQYL